MYETFFNCTYGADELGNIIEEETIKLGIALNILLVLKGIKFICIFLQRGIFYGTGKECF